MSESVRFEPDYGPDDDRRCFECGAPVGDDYESTTKYSGPITQIFSSCFNCGAPDIIPIGICPGCRGLVFEFDTKFACFNETIGTCNFSISKLELEDIGMWITGRFEFEKLLNSPVECELFDRDVKHKKFLRAELAYSEQKKWIVAVTEIA